MAPAGIYVSFKGRGFTTCEGKREFTAAGRVLDISEEESIRDGLFAVLDGMDCLFVEDRG